MTDTQIIVLNGTSSAGKTSIALELQKTLDKIYCIHGRDLFDNMFPEHIWSDMDLMREIGPKMYLGFHQSIAAYAKQGNYIIVDHIITRPEWLYECAEAFHGINSMFVGVKCPVNVAEKREQDRPDRNIGLVRSQIDLVHSHNTYDIELDTSKSSTAECVASIIERMEGGEYSAFHKLRLTNRATRTH